MSLEAQDTLEIMDLAARYNHAIDNKDVDAWLATWTPNGVLAGGLGDFTGTEPLRNFLIGFLPVAKGRHHATLNYSVSGSGDTATMICYLIILQVEGTAGLASTGIYTDRLQKVDGVWKFVYRKLVIDPTWKS